MSIDQLIKSEIRPGGLFYQAVVRACADPDVKHAIESGAGMGDGATLAIIQEFKKKNPGEIKFFPIELSKRKFDIMKAAFADLEWLQPINGNAAAADDYLSKADIEAFFWDPDNAESSFKSTKDLDEIYRDLKRETDYIAARASTIQNEALDFATSEIEPAEDEVIHLFLLLNGSDYAGEAEYDAGTNDYDPKYIALFDTKGIKNFKVKKQIIDSGNYSTLSSGKEASGKEWIIFKRIES